MRLKIPELIRTYHAMIQLILFFNISSFNIYSRAVHTSLKNGEERKSDGYKIGIKLTMSKSEENKKFIPKMVWSIASIILKRKDLSTIWITVTYLGCLACRIYLFSFYLESFDRWNPEASEMNKKNRNHILTSQLTDVTEDRWFW